MPLRNTTHVGVHMRWMLNMETTEHIKQARACSNHKKYRMNVINTTPLSKWRKWNPKANKRTTTNSYTIFVQEHANKCHDTDWGSSASRTRTQTCTATEHYPQTPHLPPAKNIHNIYRLINGIDRWIISRVKPLINRVMPSINRLMPLINRLVP